MKRKPEIETNIHVTDDKIQSPEREDVMQAMKAAGFDDQTSSPVARAISYWAFVEPVKLTVINQHEPALDTIADLRGEWYQAHSRGATEDCRQGRFRLPPGPTGVLFITGRAYVGLPKPDKTCRLLNGMWQTAIAVLLQGDAEGGLFGGKGNPPSLRVIMDRISGVYIGANGGPITCASFAEKVTHPRGRSYVQALVDKLAHSALTSGLSTEDLDVRHLAPDHLIKQCLSRKQNRHELCGQLPSTGSARRLARQGNYEPYLTSQEWKEFALAFKKLVAGPCELCGNVSMLGRGSKMEVHHLAYDNVLGREQDVPYAVTKVCDRCHNLLESLKYEHRASYDNLCRMCGC